MLLRKSSLKRSLFSTGAISLDFTPDFMILVTGAAGFIGFHVASNLIRAGQNLVGLDNFSPYCDTEIKDGRSLKRSRAEELRRLNGDFQMIKGDICDAEQMRALFARHKFTAVIHLAAMAGVRASVEVPTEFLACNVSGFANILECSIKGVEHLVYASSSSVYGGLNELPFRETQAADKPLSVYAASKRAKELLAHVYASQYGLPVTGLRYFTVYGPWARPDMALFSFARAMRAAEPIKLYNQGNHRRSFCYVEDAAAMTVAALAEPPPPGGQENGVASPPWRVLNIAGPDTIPLLRYVELLEQALQCKAEVEMLPLQSGDMVETHAHAELTRQVLGELPATPVEEGIKAFARWYDEEA